MSKSDSPPKKVQVSTLQLRKKLEDLANPVPRRSPSVSRKKSTATRSPHNAPVVDSPISNPVSSPVNHAQNHPSANTPPATPKIQEQSQKQSKSFPPEKNSSPTPEAIAPVPLIDDLAHTQEKPVPTPVLKKVKSASSIFWRHLPNLVVLMEIAGVVSLLWLGFANLIEPDLSAKLLQACQGKLQGRWQTRWGFLDFTETNEGLVKGKFEYRNVDRGQVQGQLSGRLDGLALRFSWQETYSNNSKQTGNGVFIFGEDCQDFYGSTGPVGNWQGRRITPTNSATSSVPNPAPTPTPSPTAP